MGRQHSSHLYYRNPQNDTFMLLGTHTSITYGFIGFWRMIKNTQLHLVNYIARLEHLFLECAWHVKSEVAADYVGSCVRWQRPWHGHHERLSCPSVLRYLTPVRAQCHDPGVEEAVHNARRQWKNRTWLTLLIESVERTKLSVWGGGEKAGLGWLQPPELWA